MGFFTLFLTLFGLYAIFIEEKEDPIIGMVTIFAFFWTIYEIFFKPEEPGKAERILNGTSRMKARDWIELIVLAFCFIWILAAAELIK